jgi:hypothetical protein
VQSVPLLGELTRRCPVDAGRVPAQRSPIAALVACLAGYGVIRHSRSILHNGVSSADGGGWTAAIMSEEIVCFVTVALVST